MKRRRRVDKRDPTELTLREISRYIDTHPEIEPYAKQFTHIVLDRLNAIVYRASTIRHLMGVKEGEDELFYKKVLGKIEIQYPTWMEIKDKILAGEEIKFPKMSDFSKSKY